MTLLQVFNKLERRKTMIRLEMDPQSNAESDVWWDFNWAFDNAKDLPEFVSNAGIEAQTAILAILSRMYERINLVTLGRMTKKQAKVVKDVLIQVACQDVDVAMFDQFRHEMGRESDSVS